MSKFFFFHQPQTRSPLVLFGANFEKMLLGTNNLQNPNGDFEAPSGPSDGVSSVSWSPTSNMLTATAWDNTIRCWEVHVSQGPIEAGSTRPRTVINSMEPKAMLTQAAPILCSAWSGDGGKVAFAGLDKTVKIWDLAAGGKETVLGQHDHAVKEVAYINELNLVVTGSWDKTLRYWDGRQPTAALTVPLPERCYGLSVVHPMLVVITADRHILMYNLSSPQQPFGKQESLLKRQLRTVACFPDASGFAYGSIEGRVGIHFVNQPASNFAFKCHRVAAAAGNSTDIYPVNGISFHREYGTFATGGSDGVYNFWDKDEKSKVGDFKRSNLPITCCSFSAQGNLFAYGNCYDWSQGPEVHNPQTAKSHVMVHSVVDKEIARKPKTRK